MSEIRSRSSRTIDALGPRGLFSRGLFSGGHFLGGFVSRRIVSRGMVLFALGVALLSVACTVVEEGAPPSGVSAASTSVANADSSSVGQGGAQGSVVANVQPTLADVVARVSPSVVFIEGDSQFGAVGGTGLVIDRDGHILTNHHVVNGQSNLKVTLPDGSASRAVFVGGDSENDLAVIRATGFQPEQLRPATLGDSAAVRVGEPVFAIGNPFSQTFSVTAGIVSAVDRTWRATGSGRVIHGVIQTDAALNHGNSGGPLFTMQGEVVGINTAIHNPEGGVFAGIGFAVPSNTAKRYLPQMLAGERIQHAQLGVVVQELDEVRAEDMGAPVSRGLYITGVTAGSAAERAGIVVGDVIVEVNGVPSRAFRHLAQAISESQVGDAIELRVHRGGGEQVIRATLQAWDMR